MTARMFVMLLASSLIITPSFSKDKERDWRTGKLVNIEEGAAEHRGYVAGGTGGYSECRTWLYTVETDTMTYVFSAHTGAWCADHPHPFTIGSQVKFALGEKGKAFLVDEDSKEFKAQVIKKTPKRPAP